jgi:hypothetical protein
MLTAGSAAGLELANANALIPPKNAVVPVHPTDWLPATALFVLAVSLQTLLPALFCTSMVCVNGELNVMPVLVVAQHPPCIHSLLAAVVMEAGDVEEVAAVSNDPNPFTSSATSMSIP